jgi:Pheromone A receptor
MAVRTLPPRVCNNLTGTLLGLNMYHIWTGGREVKSILGCSTGSPSYNHYTRLLMLSGIDILVTIPFNIWYFTTWFPIYPWPGWNAIHSSWSYMTLTTAELTKIPSMFYEHEITRWMYVVYGFIFFGLFGVVAEVWTYYASAWQYVSKIFCWQTGHPRESSRYVLGFVLFQSFFHCLIDLRLRILCPRRTHMSFAMNKHSAPDTFNFSGPPYEISGTTVTASSTLDVNSKPEADSQSTLSRVLANPSPVSQQYTVTRILPPLTPPDLESGSGVQ